MTSNKQFLVLVASLVWILICVKGSVIRKKREGPGAVASFFMDKVADGMAIIEHGAGYKGQQDHQFDFFGAKAGIDAKPNIGFGDTARTDTENDRRKKRQSENNQEEKPDDIQNIFQDMWGAIVDGGKKIVKKFGDMIEGEGAKQQKGQEQAQQTQHQTY